MNYRVENSLPFGTLHSSGRNKTISNESKCIIIMWQDDTLGKKQSRVRGIESRDQGSTKASVRLKSEATQKSGKIYFRHRKTGSTKDLVIFTRAVSLAWWIMDLREKRTGDIKYRKFLLRCFAAKRSWEISKSWQGKWGQKGETGGFVLR